MSSMSDDAGAARPQRSVALDVTFENRGDRLLGLGFANALLKLCTLGVYSFWAKTEIRRRIWSFIRVNGEPLEYTGTGRELLLGFLIATALIFLPALAGGIVVALIFPSNARALSIYQVCLYAGFFLLLGNAIYRAWRYRLSRTRWRGIRCALVGSPARYGWTYFWTLALPLAAICLIAALGAWAIGPQVGGGILIIGLIAGLWVFPWRANKLQRMMTIDTRFGEVALTYDGRPGPLYKNYFTTWSGGAVVLVAAVLATSMVVMQSGLDYDPVSNRNALPPLGPVLAIIGIWIAALIFAAVLTAWYRANQMKHFARHTHFDQAEFRSDVTGPGLVWIVMSNWLLAVFGLLAGVATAGALIYAFGLLPTFAAREITLPIESTPASPDLGLLRGGIVFASIITVTTITTTFAQFRSARYFMSRLKLDGTVDLSAIAQSQANSPKSGEGLAQVFDIDAF